MVRHVAVAVSAPVVAALILTVAFIAAEAAGLRPLAGRALSMSELAALGDVPGVMRALYDGANPLERYPIGSDIIPGADAPLTPMEAAAAADRADVVRLLKTWGVPPAR